MRGGGLGLRTVPVTWVRNNALFTGPALRHTERLTRRTRRAALDPSGTERYIATLFSSDLCNLHKIFFCGLYRMIPLGIYLPS